MSIEFKLIVGLNIGWTPSQKYNSVSCLNQPFIYNINDVLIFKGKVLFVILSESSFSVQNTKEKNSN